MSSYILLQVKPKLPDAKIRSRRFLDAMGGMDNGFSSCTAPAFCRGPGISNICRYLRIPWVAGKSQSWQVWCEGFRLREKSNSRGMRVKQFLEAGNIERQKTQVEHG